ncbi:integrase [Streptomyces sp. H10-C2]|uniref:integrase n=1 Tax=unclassified Streptomyces TaxID=2593676 RepID=UPI0024BBCF04|nr:MULTISPECIES: integrase [unclassified Streptomyces]MDJ0340182.1 integrase [Streptomyces sp. PH10-H1]MDJ0369181.1 integrase [Streptomyces sp. H10-C2]
MILPLPQQRRPSLFRDDEPVAQGRSLLPEAREPGAYVPRFGDTGLWNFNGVLKRPANANASDWKVNFSLELQDPYWNLLTRELMMIIFNQHHPAVLKLGIVLDGTTSPRTLIRIASCLRTTARWAQEEGPSTSPDEWTTEDPRQRIASLTTDGLSPDTIRNYVTCFKSLAAAEPLLSLPWPAGDPWPGQSARRVAEITRGRTIATPTVPPTTWFPLIRAAWAYIHDFAPDVLRADRRLHELRSATRLSVRGIDERIEEWLSDPQNKIPVHAASAEDQVPQVQWKLLTLLLGYEPDAHGAISSLTCPARVRRRTLILDAVAAGRTTTHALTGELAQVVRSDGSTGPWHPGIDQRTLFDVKTALRDAAFCLVVGLSMMRDSEIHEIMRDPVVEHYSTSAIASTKIKGTTNRPGKHWWIAEPLVEALAVAEAVSQHPERVFSPVHASKLDGTLDGVDMLVAFMAFVNSGRTWTGLDEIPTAYVRPHMFRRTMAMLTDQFPGSEIATGIQLKHLAKRALANASTRGYAASDAEWAKYLGDALDNVKFRKIKDLYERHTAGEEIGFGPGAERVKDAFDQIDATVKARNGDARTADTLLRTTRIHIRFGMLNNCTADHTNPVGAVCLENAIIPEGHTGPLDERCRPDRCANSMIGPEHLPIYDSHQRTQLQLINNPSTPGCRRDLAERELDITRGVLKMVGEAQ